MKFVNIPPAEYIGDMALCEQLLVYHFFFRMKHLKGIDFLAGSDCKQIMNFSGAMLPGLIDLHTHHSDERHRNGGHSLPDAGRGLNICKPAPP